MESLGGEVARNKAMMMGANPSERWGHSACYFNGFIYIFGGCRGGVHFSDVLVCNLKTMTWSILKTSGQGPGPRDSHTASLVGSKMLVFGGTNGCKKVNDLRILDLLSREWTHPQCRGDPPCPRESHTANVISDDKLVIFGGSGEGEGNYLSDLHILDLNDMEWSSPVVRGSAPTPRDSHSSVAVGNRLFVFGGDSGDRYQGDVFVLDLNKLVWSKLDAHGPSPGARAGHAAVSIGPKVYILGGVGDKQYYSDIWVLDVITSCWVQLETNSRKSQGRFSHTATVTNLGVAVFGGCGEDERPLSELLILQIDSLTCRASTNSCREEETKMSLKKAENNLVHQKTVFVGDNEDSTSLEVKEVEFHPKQSFRFSSDMLHPKRRRTSNSKLPQKNRELEEHSLSRSQQSSSSQSDHEQTDMRKNVGPTCPSSRIHPMFRQNMFSPSCFQPYQNNNKHAISRFPDPFLSSEHPNQFKQHVNIGSNDAESLSIEGKMRNLIGAEVRGQVDGAFDSGYLMTATINGKAFRGVLFAPTNSGQNRPLQMQTRGSPPIQAGLPLGKESRANSELQGVVLTLASPGSALGGL